MRVAENQHSAPVPGWVKQRICALSFTPAQYTFITDARIPPVSMKKLKYHVVMITYSQTFV